MEKLYEVYYKSGKREVVSQEKLPSFSAAFNSQVQGLKIGEQMYEMTEGVIIKRLQ